MLLSKMNTKRKLRTAAATGEALADWVNRELEHGENPTAWLIAFCVNAVHARRERGLVPEFDKDLWELTMNVHVKIWAEDGHIKLEFVPQDDDSRALYGYSQLRDSGNASRLKPCQNCGRVFYSAGRANRRYCLDSCRVGFWQKTPAGRKKRREYMREYRAMIRKRELKGSRLKVSKGILRNLGKS